MCCAGFHFVTLLGFSRAWTDAFKPELLDLYAIQDLVVLTYQSLIMQHFDRLFEVAGLRCWRVHQHCGLIRADKVVVILCICFQRNNLDTICTSLQRQIYVFGGKNVLLDFCFQLSRNHMPKQV